MVTDTQQTAALQTPPQTDMFLASGFFEQEGVLDALDWCPESCLIYCPHPSEEAGGSLLGRIVW